MNTQTHLLISAVALTRPDRPLRNAAVIAGAILPDASIFALVIWARMNDVPERAIWREHYWQDPWQTIGGASQLLSDLWSRAFALHFVAGVPAAIPGPVRQCFGLAAGCPDWPAFFRLLPFAYRL